MKDLIKSFWALLRECPLLPQPAFRYAEQEYWQYISIGRRS